MPDLVLTKDRAALQETGDRVQRPINVDDLRRRIVDLVGSRKATRGGSARNSKDSPAAELYVA